MVLPTAQRRQLVRLQLPRSGHFRKNVEEAADALRHRAIGAELRLRRHVYFGEHVEETADALRRWRGTRLVRCIGLEDKRDEQVIRTGCDSTADGTVVSHRIAPPRREVEHTAGRVCGRQLAVIKLFEARAKLTSDAGGHDKL